MSQHTDAHATHAHGNHGGSTKEIWRTFWILLFITVGEVGLAFTSIPFSVLKLIFIGLTLVKAYFIVFNFMHLKHEKSPFAKVILLPFMMIIYLIFMALYEGTAIKDLTVYLGQYL